MKKVFKAGGLTHTLVDELNGIGIYELTLKNTNECQGYNIGRFNKRTMGGRDFDSFIFLKSAYTLASAQNKLKELLK
jgi:hypothetical protein